MATKIASCLLLDVIYGKIGLLPFLLRYMGTLHDKSICELQERAICKIVAGDKFWSFVPSSISDSLPLFIQGERYVLIPQNR